MIANIFFNVTFQEVPECSKKGARDRGGAVTKLISYSMMTALFCFANGMMLSIGVWVISRALCSHHHEDHYEYSSHELSPVSSGSSYDSMATPPPSPVPSPVPSRGPSPVPSPVPPRAPSPARAPPPRAPSPARRPPPTIRLPTPEIQVTSTAPAPQSTSASRWPPVDPRQSPVDERPMRPAPGSRAAPPPQQQLQQQQLRLPQIGGQEQRLSPRQGGLRASFVQWGGAALSSLRASFAGVSGRGEPPPPQQQQQQRGGSRPPARGGARPPPQGAPRPPPQGRPPPPPQRGPRPPAQGQYRPPPPGGARPPAGRSQPRYKMSPSRPGSRKGPT